jgi:hypothetical protein
VNVDDTAVQMLIRRDRGSVIAIFPECALTSFTPIEFLRGPARDQLHALRNHIAIRVLDQKMNVIGRDHVVEHAKPEAFLKRQPLGYNLSLHLVFESALLLSFGSSKRK